MKHILNDISQEEKNRILEQHSGGKTIDTTKFKRLLESTLGNVKPLISEQDTATTQTTTVTTPTDQNTQNANVDTTNWIKTIAYVDSGTTEPLTNIQINPETIRLVGSNVDFDYVVAGKNVVGVGHFYCDGGNTMVFEGKPMSGTLHISPKRIDALKSKCGAEQGYASTNKGTDQNFA